ncbi:MAG TPA: outer membrane beta-barrel protein [Candidatus Kapabacteria bacterium]|nr:outer membrane beta-barrel protein [Candidatus Kapabacteria bacterium]
MNVLIPIAAGALLLAGTPVALAQQDRTGSLYLGATFQKIALESDGLYDSLALDDTDSDYAVFGGIRFSRTFALEIDYAPLGEFAYLGGSVEYSGAQVAGLMVAPVDTELELFARGGVGLVEVDQSAPAFNDTSTAFSLGVGADWTPRDLDAITVRVLISTRWIRVEPRDAQPGDPGQRYDQNLYEYGVGMAYNF